jgi:hypothetical protein
MTRESLVSLSPEAVIDLAKAYFTDAQSGYSGTLVEDGDGFARFQTFRGQLAVAAVPDGEQTLVRCSTLRYHPSIGKFLLSIASESSLPGA